MRADRLLRLLFVLQRRQAAPARELAQELEVSLRTLYRDVASLGAAGVPLYTERGPGGGIRLVPGWRTRLDGLTAHEASALSLSGAPQAQSDLGLASVALTAEAKLEATLPAELRGRAARIRERFLLDVDRWFRRHAVPKALASVAQAVWSQHRIEVWYGAKPARHRRVDPLGLVMKAGVWYLVARHRGACKSYRVEHIQRARLLSEAFERPEAFDLRAFWAESTRSFDAALLRYRCRIRVSRRGFLALPDVIPGDAIRAQLSAAPDPDAHGQRELELHLENEAVAVTQLMALAGEVEVLAPASLRARIRELARRIAAQHKA